MSKHLRIARRVAVGLLAIVALAAPAMAQAAVATRYHTDIDGLVVMWCSPGTNDGELALMSGTADQLITETVAGSGLRYYHVHQRTVLRGVGLTSGDSYVAIGTYNLAVGGLPADSFDMLHTFTLTQQNHDIQLGSGNDWQATFVSHFTYDADGEVISVHLDAKSECLG